MSTHDTSKLVNAFFDKYFEASRQIDKAAEATANSIKQGEQKIVDSIENMETSVKTKIEKANKEIPKLKKAIEKFKNSTEFEIDGLSISKKNLKEFDDSAEQMLKTIDNVMNNVQKATTKARKVKDIINGIDLNTSLQDNVKKSIPKSSKKEQEYITKLLTANVELEKTFKNNLNKVYDEESGKKAIIVAQEYKNTLEETLNIVEKIKVENNDLIDMSQIKAKLGIINTAMSGTGRIMENSLKPINSSFEELIDMANNLSISGGAIVGKRPKKEDYYKKNLYKKEVNTGRYDIQQYLNWNNDNHTRDTRKELQYLLNRFDEYGKAQTRLSGEVQARFVGLLSKALAEENLDIKNPDLKDVKEKISGYANEKALKYYKSLVDKTAQNARENYNAELEALANNVYNTIFSKPAVTDTDLSEVTKNHQQIVEILKKENLEAQEIVSIFEEFAKLSEDEKKSISNILGDNKNLKNLLGLIEKTNGDLEKTKELLGLVGGQGGSGINDGTLVIPEKTINKTERLKELVNKTTINFEELKEILSSLPDNKIKSIATALEMAMNVDMDAWKMFVKKSEMGKYFTFEGTRSGAKFFLNNDGEFTRKPNKNKVSFVDDKKYLGKDIEYNDRRIASLIFDLRDNLMRASSVPNTSSSGTSKEIANQNQLQKELEDSIKLVEGLERSLNLVTNGVNENSSSEFLKTQIEALKSFEENLISIEEKVKSLNLDDSLKSGVLGNISELKTSFETNIETLTDWMNKAIDTSTTRNLEEDVSSFIATVSHLENYKSADPQWLSDYIDKIRKGEIGLSAALDEYKNKLAEKMQEIADEQERNRINGEQIQIFVKEFGDTSNFDEGKLTKYGEILSQVSSGALSAADGIKQFKAEISTTQQNNSGLDAINEYIRKSKEVFGAKKATNIDELYEMYQNMRAYQRAIEDHPGTEFAKDARKFQEEIVALNPQLERLLDNWEKLTKKKFKDAFGGSFEATTLSSQVEERIDSVNSKLQDSKKYVNELRQAFMHIIGRTNDRNELLTKYPELSEFKNRRSVDNARKFIDTDEWNDFLSTLPKAHEYLKSIEYDFERIYKLTDKEIEWFKGLSYEELIERLWSLNGIPAKEDYKAIRAAFLNANKDLDSAPALPFFNEESTGQLAMQIEGVTEASWDLGKAEKSTAEDMSFMNTTLEGQIELLDYLATQKKRVIKLDERAKASRNNWAWGDMGQFHENDANDRYQQFLGMFNTSEMNEQQVAYFEQRAKDFAGLITEMYNDQLRREANNPSSVFTGGSNFNVNKFYKKQDAMMKKQEEYEQKVSRFIENTKKGLKELLSEEEQLAIYREGRWNRDDDKIATNDPLALKKHEAKLEFLEKEHAEMLAYNKEAKKAGKEKLPSWKLAYSSRAINEEKKTIEALKQLAEQGTEDIITAFTDGTKLIRSAVDNRIKFKFDGKPDDETRNLLKSNGFKWASKEGVWQRQWKTKNGASSNSEYSTKRIIEQLKLEEVQAEQTAEAEKKLNKIRKYNIASRQNTPLLAKNSSLSLDEDVIASEEKKHKYSVASRENIPILKEKNEVEQEEQLTSVQKRRIAQQKRYNELKKEENQYSREAVEIARELLKQVGLNPSNEITTRVKLAAEYDDIKDMNKLLDILADRVNNSKSIEYLKELAPDIYEIINGLKTVRTIKYNTSDVEAFGDAWEFVQEKVGKSHFSLTEGTSWEMIDFSESLKSKIYENTNDFVSGLSQILNDGLFINGKDKIHDALKEQFINNGLDKIGNTSQEESKIVIKSFEDIETSITSTKRSLNELLEILEQSGKLFGRDGLIKANENIVGSPLYKDLTDSNWEVLIDKTGELDKKYRQNSEEESSSSTPVIVENEKKQQEAYENTAKAKQEEAETVEESNDRIIKSNEKANKSYDNISNKLGLFGGDNNNNDNSKDTNFDVNEARVLKQVETAMGIATVYKTLEGQIATVVNGKVLSISTSFEELRNQAKKSLDVIMRLNNELRNHKDKYGDNFDTTAYENSIKKEILKLESYVTQAQIYAADSKYALEAEQVLRDYTEVKNNILDKQARADSVYSAKVLEKHEKETSKLDQLKSQYNKKLSSINNVFSYLTEYSDVQTEINNLVSIDDVSSVETAFNKLENIINNFKQNVKSSASLDPVFATIKKKNDLDNIVEGYKLSFEQIGFSSDEASKKVSNLLSISSEMKKVDLQSSNGMIVFGEEVRKFNVEEDKIKNLIKITKQRQQVYEQNYSAIQKYEQAHIKLNELYIKEQEKGSSAKLTADIEVQKKAISELKKEAIDASKEINKMFKEGSISSEQRSNALNTLADTYRGKTPSDTALNTVKQEQQNKAIKNLEDLISKLEKAGDYTSDLQEKATNLWAELNKTDSKDNLLQITEEIKKISEEFDQLKTAHDARIQKQKEIQAQYDKNIDTIKQLEIETDKLNNMMASDIGKNKKSNQIEDQLNKTIEAAENAKKAIEDVNQMFKDGNISKGQQMDAGDKYRKASDGSTASQAKYEDAKAAQSLRDEKEAADELKKSLDNLVTAYTNLASDSKGKRSVTFNEDVIQVRKAREEFENTRNEAQRLGLSLENITKLEEEAFSNLQTKIAKSGATTIDGYIDSLDKLEEKMKQSGNIGQKSFDNIQMLKNTFALLQSNKDFSTFEGIQKYLEQIDKLGAELPQIMKEIETLGKIENIQSQFNFFDQLEVKSVTYRSTLSELKNKLDEFQKTMDSGDKELISKAQVELLKEAAPLINKLYKEAQGKGNLIDSSIGKVTDIDSLKKSMINYAESLGYTKQVSQAVVQENGQLTISFKNSKGEILKMTGSIDALNQGLRETSVVSKTTTGFVTNLKVSFKQMLGYFTRYYTGYMMMTRAIGAFRDGINIVKEFDAAMTELIKVSNDSEEVLRKFGSERAFDIASSIGGTGKDVINSAADWERLGYSIEEADELAKNSILYSKVGDMDIDTATEHLVSTLKAYKEFDAKTSQLIVDKFNEIKFLSLCT